MKGRWKTRGKNKNGGSGGPLVKEEKISWYWPFFHESHSCFPVFGIFPSPRNSMLERKRGNVPRKYGCNLPKSPRIQNFRGLLNRSNATITAKRKRKKKRYLPISLISSLLNLSPRPTLRRLLVRIPALPSRPPFSIPFTFPSMTFTVPLSVPVLVLVLSSVLALSLPGHHRPTIACIVARVGVRGGIGVRVLLV